VDTPQLAAPNGKPIELAFATVRGGGAESSRLNFSKLENAQVRIYGTRLSLVHVEILDSMTNGIVYGAVDVYVAHGDGHGARAQGNVDGTLQAKIDYPSSKTRVVSEDVLRERRRIVKREIS
jgi:hypothetical protein